nr:unnamed protein product [Callosobruchus analis]
MIDTGCAVVTLRQRDVERFGLKWDNYEQQDVSANVALVINDDQLRILNSDILQLPEIDKLQPSKLKMIVAHEVSIPPHTSHRPYPIYHGPRI